MIIFWELIYSALSRNAPVRLRELTVYMLKHSDKYDIRKIIQPLRLSKFRSKYCWENCAKIIASKNMADMSDDVIDRLFVWLQDMNWPGAEIIYDYFLSCPYDNWIKSFERKVREALSEDDDEWLSSLQKLFWDMNPNEEAFTDVEVFHFIGNWKYE